MTTVSRISTDDEAMTLQQYWLGFPGWTFPVEWTYQRWAVVGVTFVLFAAPMVVLVGLVTSSFLFAVVGGPLIAAAVAFRFAGWAVKHMSYDQPIAYLVGVVVAAWRLSRGHVDEGPSRIEITQPKSGRLSPGAARSIRVDPATIRRLESEVFEPIEIESVLADPEWSRVNADR